MKNEFSITDSGELIKTIQDSVETKIIEVGGEEFVTRQVFFPPEKPNFSVLNIASLEGVADYLNKSIDNANDLTDVVVIINSPRKVSVRSQIKDIKVARLCFVDADYEMEGFPFERYLDHEQFMVKAQALFIDEFDRGRLLELVGNITASSVQTSVDDGVSQTVVVEKSVRKAEVELPNPVILAPRRTFAEIDQPESPFVLRVRQTGEGKMPEIGLFEADGGLWKLAAIQGIKDYLSTALTVDVPVIG